ALPQVPLSDADGAAIAALSRVLRAAAVHLQAEFAEAGRVDHTYVAGAARAALTDAGQPTDLALRTGLALRHILVDEFQDTSLAQFDLLEALTVGWEPGDGRTLFVVGDPMQSIYQFREAEVGLFLRARDHGIGGVALEPLRLTRNFRSIPRVVEWVNDTFAALFPATDDLRESAVAFTRSVASRSEPGGEVNLRLFAATDRDGETASIVDSIGRLRAAQPEADIAILVASRAHAAPIMTALEDRGIEAVGVELVPLQELPIVRDLVALLQALDHLGDRTAWLTVLRAPWCGVSLATLTAISSRDDSQLSRGESLLVWEALNDDGRLAACSPEERARLLRIRAVLAAARDSRTSVPMAEWLERTWLQLGGADAYPRRDLRHARALFTTLGERVGSGEWQGSHELGIVLAELYAQPLAVGSHPVQIMTIHRAKGLEFDHVFLPCLDRDLSRNREPLLRWLDLPRAQGESDLVMSPVPAIGDDIAGDVGNYLKRLMARRSANEQIRLLYVAATRARQSLHLSATPRFNDDGVPTPRGRTLLTSLWSAFSATPDSWIPATSDAAVAAPVELPRRVPLFRLARDWSPAILESAPERERLPLARQSLEPPEFSWVGETARHVGTVVHAALEGFGQLEQLPSMAQINARREYYTRELRRHGVPDRDLTRATQTVMEALRRTAGSDRGRWMFARGHRAASSELALTGLAGGRLTNVIVDRSFVDAAGTRWVIDFKTSRHEGGGLEAFLTEELERYRPQLQTYVDLARALGPEPVRAALYFPLLEAFRELA
ncbi:MAG TPA: 3'-5' exonuclease, partial [Steroidobacteraceae bacterium]|nr:3'-5' exonuclease [Steroidobacteraceae bacterium]